MQNMAESQKNKTNNKQSNNLSNCVQAKRKV